MWTIALFNECKVEPISWGLGPVERPKRNPTFGGAFILCKSKSLT